MTDTDEATTPRAFRRYMLKGFPVGHDWRAENAYAASHLRREYMAIHARADNGCVPELLRDFEQDLDEGIAAVQMQRGIVVKACPWGVVSEILQTVENTRGMARHVMCLEYFQDPPSSRAGRDYPEWCEANNVDERQARRLADGAMLAVWLRVVRWGRKG